MSQKVFQKCSSKKSVQCPKKVILQKIVPKSVQPGTTSYSYCDIPGATAISDGFLSTLVNYETMSEGPQGWPHESLNQIYGHISARPFY